MSLAECRGSKRYFITLPAPPDKTTSDYKSKHIVCGTLRPRAEFKEAYANEPGEAPKYANALGRSSSAGNSIKSLLGSQLVDLFAAQSESESKLANNCSSKRTLNLIISFMLLLGGMSHEVN